LWSIFCGRSYFSKYFPSIQSPFLYLDPAFLFATQPASVFIASDFYALISTPGSKTGYAPASGGVVGYATWSTVLKRNAKGTLCQE
jgi:hypothetical protein